MRTFLTGFLVFALLAIVVRSSDSPFSSHSSPLTLSRVSFGSCSRPALPQPLWDRIALDEPEVFLFLGDIVYADHSFLELLRWPASPGDHEKQFSLQAARPDYRKFVKAVPHVLGLYDDHDMGENDGDSSYPHRAAGQAALLDFLQEPENSIRRTREGLFAAYTFGQEAKKRVKIILLDTRTHQNWTSGDLLGSDQWRWFEDELKFSHSEVLPGHEPTNTQDEPDLLIIASTIQILPRNRHVGEGWQNFPSSRLRLLESLVRAGLNSSVVLLSGDVHLAEYLTSDVCTRGPILSSDTEYFHRKFIEITSSSLTHSFGTYAPAFLQGFLKIVADFILGSGQKGSLEHPERFLDLNYGLLTIDWENEILYSSVKDRQGNAVLRQKFPFEQLKRRNIKRSQESERGVFAVCDEEAANRYNAPWNLGGVKAALIAIAAIALALRTITCRGADKKKGKGPSVEEKKKNQ